MGERERCVALPKANITTEARANTVVIVDLEQEFQRRRDNSELSRVLQIGLGRQSPSRETCVPR